MQNKKYLFYALLFLMGMMAVIFVQKFEFYYRATPSIDDSSGQGLVVVRPTKYFAQGAVDTTSEDVVLKGEIINWIVTAVVYTTTLIFGFVAIISFILNAIKKNVEEDLENKLSLRVKDFEFEVHKFKELVDSYSDDFRVEYEKLVCFLDDKVIKTRREINEDIRAFREEEGVKIKKHSSYLLSKFAYLNYEEFSSGIESVSMFGGLSQKSKEMYEYNAYLKLESAVRGCREALNILEQYSDEESESEIHQREILLAYSNYAYYCTRIAVWKNPLYLNPNLLAKEVRFYISEAESAVKKCSLFIEKAKRRKWHNYHRCLESCLYAKYHFSYEYLKNEPNMLKNFKSSIQEMLDYAEVNAVCPEWIANIKRKWMQLFSKIEETVEKRSVYAE